MPVKHSDLFAALAAPFLRDEVYFRPQGARQLAYVTARTVMNRLDDVLGPGEWWDHYTPQKDSVICALTIRLPDGSTLTKEDAGGYAGMADSGDDDKSGFSDAFKRAAVKFGVGRYLYQDGLPAYVTSALNLTTEMLEVKPPSQNPSTRPSAAPPSRPQSAPAPRPSPPGPQAPPAPPQPRSDSGGRQFDHNRCPKHGKGLWAWAKEEAEIVKKSAQPGDPTLDVIGWLNKHGTEMNFPARMIDWSEDEVRSAWDAYHGVEA